MIRGRMTEHVPAVSAILDAIERREWQRLERLLHPYVRWTTAAEEQLRGRRNVIARLVEDPPAAPPARHELRDGQMYRWIDTPAVSLPHFR